MSSRKHKLTENKGIGYWFARISAVLFVVFMYSLIAEDFLKTLAYHPVLYNFFIGTVILALTLIIWPKKSRMNGLYFFVIGILYLLLMWNKILMVSIITTSAWLFLIGTLFSVDPSLEKNKKVEPKKIRVMKHKLFRSFGR